MTSVFGGPQTVPTSQATNQSINQASTSQQAAASAMQQASTQQMQTGPQAQLIGGGLANWANTIATQPQAPPIMNVAPLTLAQQNSINGLMASGMGMQPLINQGQGYIGQGVGVMGQGTGLMNQAGQGITAQDINSFYNPMAGNVTAQLQNIFGQQNLANRLGATAGAGGIGGDRAAVAQGILANQQGLAAGQIYSQLYQNALQAAEQQKAQQLGAGQGLVGAGGQLSNLAFPTMQAGFGGMETALGAGTVQQQAQQAQYNAQYQNALMNYQDPFLRMQALSGAVGPLNQAYGVGQTTTGQQAGLTGAQQMAAATGTQAGAGFGTTTYPAPSILPQVAGLGALGLGAMGLFSGSDRSLKTDIQKIGKHPSTGLPIYAYRYKGDPKSYPKTVGPMAQDVKKAYPDAVANIGGKLAIKKFQSGGAALPSLATSNLNPQLPTASDWQSRIQPALQQGMNFQPLLSGLTGGTINLGGLGGLLSNLGGGGSGGGGTGTAGSQFMWGPGQPVSQSLQNQLAAQPASFWANADPQNIGMGRIYGPGGVSGGSGSFGLKRGGRIQGYQDAGPVVSDTDSDSDSEPDSDTDDTDSSTTSVTNNLGKYAKGMNLLNQYAKSATPKTPQATPIRMPSFQLTVPTSPTIQPPAPMAMAASGYQSGGSTDTDDSGSSSTGSKTVPSADPDAASLRFETMANLAQGREVPPFQKGFAKGGPVKGYANAGEVEPAGLPVQADELPNEDESGDEAGGFGSPQLPSPYRQRLPGPTRGMGGLGGFAQSPYFALMNAGLGMLAASGQRDARGLPMSPLGAVGAGGMQGMKTLQEQQAFDLAQRKMMLPYEQLTAGQQLEAQKPVPIGPNIWGQMQYAVRTPNGQLVDPRTKQPINSSEMGEMTDAKLKSMAKGIANYDLPPISPYRMTTPAGAAIMEEVRNVNDKYDAKNYTMANQAKKAFGTGPQGEVLRRFNTYVAHSYTLENALQALEQAKLSGDYRVFNAISQTWADQTGSPLPRTFNAIRDIYGNEAVAATVGMRNALGDREEIHKQMSAIDSPQALRGIINAHRELAGGNIRSLKREYETATMGAQDFEDKLLPESREALSKIRSYNRPEGQPAEPPEKSSVGAKAVDTRDEAALKADPRNAAIRKAIDKKYGEGTSARLVGE